ELRRSVMTPRWGLERPEGRRLATKVPPLRGSLRFKRHRPAFQEITHKFGAHRSKIGLFRWREAVKKLGGRASWRAIAPASPCPMRLGGSLALPISPPLNFFQSFKVRLFPEGCQRKGG